MSSKLKTALKSVAARLGWEVSRIPKSVRRDPVPEYQPVRPYAVYSPWNVDAEFIEVRRQVQDNTLVDVYRSYELWQLMAQAAKLEAGSIIEVGAWRGGSGALLATRARRLGLTDRVYLCDTFTGLVKIGPKDSHCTTGLLSDTSLDLVEDLVYRRLSLDNVTILQGIFPNDTGAAVENERFRLCHVDVDVYQSAKDVVEWIWDRLVPGGIVVFDDYGFRSCDGVTRYVNEQMAAPDRIVLHNLNGHAIFIKR